MTAAFVQAVLHVDVQISGLTTVGDLELGCVSSSPGAYPAVAVVLGVGASSLALMQANNCWVILSAAP